jgi:hypothetical protein
LGYGIEETMSRSVNAETVTKDYYFINAKRNASKTLSKKNPEQLLSWKKKNLDCALTKYLLQSFTFICGH